MTRRRKATSPVPLGPAHRRDWRAFWRRCTCGLGTPCVDRLVPAAPLPFPARPDRTSFPTSPPALPITDSVVPDHALSFAATDGNASKPWPPTSVNPNQSHTAHGGITATSTPPMSRENATPDRRSTPISGILRSFEPSCLLPPVRLPSWPGGSCGRRGRTFALAELGSARATTGSAPTVKPDDPCTTRLSNRGDGTVRSSHHQTAPMGVSPPTRHGVAGGRPQMAYHHINLGRR